MTYKVLVPEISDERVASSLKSRTRALLLIMLELFIEPVLVLLPSRKGPALMLVAPVKVLVPDKVKVPAPCLVRLPVPLMTPLMVSLPASPVVSVTPVPI